MRLENPPPSRFPLLASRSTSFNPPIPLSVSIRVHPWFAILGQHEMNENIDVYVNDQKIALYRGMKVKHALIAYDQSLYKAALAGEVRVEDENGFTVGLEGSLADGAKIFTIATG